MNQWTTCIAHNTSEGHLLTSGQGAAMFDCGMLFCAGETIRLARHALNGLQPTHLFASHTHYDHIGALPALRAVWPGIQLVTSAIGAEILQKETPRRVIREMNQTASQTYAPEVPVNLDYDDDAFRADLIVKEGDTVRVGDCTVEIIETPGHTRDTLSFFVRETGVLSLSETSCVLLPDGSVYPGYLISFRQAIASIEKCRRVPYRTLSLPHRGIMGDAIDEHFLDTAYEATVACHDFILEQHAKGLDEPGILEAYDQRYGTESLLAFQPKEAFYMNARATIACTLREMREEEAIPQA